MEKAGLEYYDSRADLMVDSNEGLTRTYTRFHDPEESAEGIHKLRELHAAMDRAVLDAYGWSDISTDCEFIPDFTEEDDDGNIIEKNIRYRWPDEVRDEVLARLLALNAERYQEELAAGLHSKAKQKTARKITRKSPTKRKSKFERELPSPTRIAASTTLGYAMSLIVSLISESGGQLSWERLRDGFILATNHKLLKSFALNEEKGLIGPWSEIWNESLETNLLIPSLKSLLGGVGLQVAPDQEALHFELLDGPQEAATEHIGYDAWLIHRVASRLSGHEIEDLVTLHLDEEVKVLVA